MPTEAFSTNHFSIFLAIQIDPVAPISVDACILLVLRYGPAVSVTEFKDLAEEISGGDPEMKLVPRTIGPVQTSLHKLFKIKYTTYF